MGFDVFPVRYHCPHCKTIVTLEREGYLADKSVTPFPLEGWSYAAVGGDYESADGVRIRCGEGEIDGEGCAEVYYLNFVRFEDGREVAAPVESEYVDIAAGPTWPRGPE